MLVVLALMLVPAYGQEITWETTGLPHGYSGVAQLEHNGGESVQVIEFASHRDWLTSRTYNIIEGVGRTLVDARHSTRDESWMMRPSSYQVVRSDRFATTRTDAAENYRSPFGVIRPLIAAGDGADLEPVPGEAGRGVFDLRSSILNARLNFEDGKLVRVRQAPINGTDRHALDIRYAQWVDLPSGARVPSSVEVRSEDHRGEVWTTKVSISDLRELDDDASAPAFQVPSDFTIVDRIEGVTKTADGEILGEIEYPDDARSGRSRPDAFPLIGAVIGLGLLVGAGLVWRWRSGKSP